MKALKREGSVEVPGGRIWYCIRGDDDGVPLVVVHGGRGSLTTISSRWRRWLDSLSYPQVHLLGHS